MLRHRHHSVVARCESAGRGRHSTTARTRPRSSTCPTTRAWSHTGSLGHWIVGIATRAATIERSISKRRAIASFDVLFQHGAQVSAKAGRQQQVPLQGAAQWGWTQVVTYLIGKGADVMRRIPRGLTPLELRNGPRREETAAVRSARRPPDLLVFERRKGRNSHPAAGRRPRWSSRTLGPPSPLKVLLKFHLTDLDSRGCVRYKLGSIGERISAACGRRNSFRNDSTALEIAAWAIAL